MPHGRPRLEHLVSVPTRPAGGTAADVEGVDLSGARCRLPLGTDRRRTVLLFLGTSCDGCRPFWLAAGAPGALGLAPGDGVVVVARPAPPEDLCLLRSLAKADRGPGAVVLSDAAWRDYRVQGPPFFALVEEGRVTTEGVAWSVQQVEADVRRALGRAGTDVGGVRPAVTGIPDADGMGGAGE